MGCTMQKEDLYLWQSTSAGGTGGGPFTDLSAIGADGQTQLIQASAYVTEIALRGGSAVDSVKLTLNTGALPAHGGTGGGEMSLKLGRGESISVVHAWVGTYNNNTCLVGIELVTDKNKKVTVGQQTGTPTTFNVPSSFHVVGFFGRSGTIVDQLGVYAARVFD